MSAAAKLTALRDRSTRILRALRRYGGMNIHSARQEREPTEWPERLAWGLTQQVVGARLLLAHRDLLRAALVPPFWLALFCLLVALARVRSGPLAMIRTFYLTFASLAPLPSLVFARHYARLSALAHRRFGFGECAPRIERLRISIRRVLHGFIMVSIAPVVVAAPFAILLVALSEARPAAGILYAVVTALWALHWIIVDALDNAQVLAPGETLAQAEAKGRSLPEPWFVRALRRIQTRRRRQRNRGFAGFLERYSRFWREEIDLIERHPTVAIGFGVATAALLATPVLNLFFRPITIAAAVHLSGVVEEGAEAVGRSEPRAGSPASV
ncbi:MAG TPA: hypothetical protein VKN99_22630 [Polyangia bacterium]|nr:hypothetical protein [Polyangia bacterium]